MSERPLRSLLELTRVRVLVFLREPEILFWVFAFPVVMAAILGFAFRRQAAPLSRVGLVIAGAEAERELGERLEQGRGLELRRPAPEAAESDLRRGRVDSLLYADSPPRLRYDTTRPEGELARLRVEQALAPSGEEARGASTLTIDPVDERGSRYLDFLFPGLLGMNLMSTGMWSLGFAIAEMRQKRLLRRLLVTPMRRSTFLLSLLLARFVFLLLEVTVLVLFGVLALDVPFRSGIVPFALLCALAGLSFASIGLLAVARVKTIQGASGLLNLVMVPMWLGSGIFFSYERFPEAVQPFLRLLPLTSLNDALRALMLDGADWTSLLPEIGLQAAWLALSATLALRLFRWE